MRNLDIRTPRQTGHLCTKLACVVCRGDGTDMLRITRTDRPIPFLTGRTISHVHSLTQETQACSEPRIQRRHWLGCAIATGDTMAGLRNSRPGRSGRTAEPGVILTVSGQIGQTNRDGKAVFDHSHAAKAAPTHLHHPNPRAETRGVFSGPLLKDVLAAVKATAAN